MSLELTLGISPCPNDTFIFGPLILGKIRSPELRFLTRFLDVEKLNLLAVNRSCDVLKISAATFARVHAHYTLLGAGGAMGYGCGPLLVSGPGTGNRVRTIAVPGMLTTATMLLLRFLQHPSGLQDRTVFQSAVLEEDGRETDYCLVEMSYERIIPAVQKGEVDFGVIIHEGRFTYQSHFLDLVQDLGKWWEKEKGLPLPLGIIVVRRSLGEVVKVQVEEIIRQSLEYAQAHSQDIWPFIREHAQELDDEVLSCHIQTFVNDFSRDMGWTARQALSSLLDLDEQYF